MAESSVLTAPVALAVAGDAASLLGTAASLTADDTEVVSNLAAAPVPGLSPGAEDAANASAVPPSQTQTEFAEDLAEMAPAGLQTTASMAATAAVAPIAVQAAGSATQPLFESESFACQVTEGAVHTSAHSTSSHLVHATESGAEASDATRCSFSQVAEDSLGTPIRPMLPVLSESKGTAAHPQPADSAQSAVTDDSAHPQTGVDMTQTAEGAVIPLTQAADSRLESPCPTIPDVPHVAEVIEDFATEPAARTSSPCADSTDGPRDCSSEVALAAVLSSTVPSHSASSVVSETVEPLADPSLPSEDAVLSFGLAADSAVPQEAPPACAQRKTSRSKPQLTCIQHMLVAITVYLALCNLHSARS